MRRGRALVGSIGMLLSLSLGATAQERPNFAGLVIELTESGLGASPRTTTLVYARRLLAGGAASGSSSRQESLVVGSWTCEKSCPDEEIAFTIEDGKQVYASWLHHRPSVVNAEWILRGSDLTVTRDGEVLYEWRVVQVTKTRLVLRDKQVPAGSKLDDMIMKRIRER